MSTYLKEDAGGFDVDDVRTRFISQLRAASAAALGPARALLDSSTARAIAMNLGAAIDRAPEIFEMVLAERRRLQADTSTRTEVLRERWDTFCGKIEQDINTTQQTLTTGVSQLSAALAEEALPTTSDPAAVLVARQEIELALRAAALRDSSPFETLLTQAHRGLDIAAAAASEWGRMTLVAAQGDDDGFALVVNAAIDTALTNATIESQRRAAEALVATRTPRPGETVAALPEAQSLAGFVLGVASATCRHGIVLR